MAITFQTKADAAVPTPPAGSVSYYVDSTFSLLSMKGSNGVIQRLNNLPLPNRVIAVGHSYLFSTGASIMDTSIAAKIGGMIHGSLEPIGTNGAQIGQDENGVAGNGVGGWAKVLQIPRLIPLRQAAPYGLNGYMGMVLYGINDEGCHHADANAIAVWKNGLRVCASRLSASAIFEDTDASIAYGVGTWQPAFPDTTRNSGTSFRPFPTNGAVFTHTIKADYEGGPIAVGLIAWPNSDAVITWSGTASFASGTTSLVSQAYASGGAPGSTTRSSPMGMVARFNGIASDAGKTLIGTIACATTQFATPAAPGSGITHGGTVGLATYGYKWVSLTQNGYTLQSTEQTTTTGNATLGLAGGQGTNIIPAPPAFPAGVVAMSLIRSTGTAGTPSLGVIGTITAPASITDSGQVATVQPQIATANPLVQGGAFDYVQYEGNNPTAIVAIVNILRPLAAGYVFYPSTGSVAITSGGGVGSSAIVPTGGIPAGVVAGSTINLTGGTAEAFKVLSVTGGTTINIVGVIANAGHTTLFYGYPSDNDTVLYNAAAVQVAAEFLGGTVYVADVDTLVNASPSAASHYFADGLHLNDRGITYFAEAFWTPLVSIALAQPPRAIAAQSRQVRRPESHVVLAPPSGNITIASTSWAVLVDGLAVALLTQIQAYPDDDLRCNVSGVWNSEAFIGLMDIATVGGGLTIINTFSGIAANASSFGLGGLYGQTLTNAQWPFSVSKTYKVKAADLQSGGYVYVGIIGRIFSAGSKSIFGANPQFAMDVENLGASSPSYGF